MELGCVGLCFCAELGPLEDGVEIWGMWCAALELGIEGTWMDNDFKRRLKRGLGGEGICLIAGFIARVLGAY